MESHLCCRRQNLGLLRGFCPVDFCGSSCRWAARRRDFSPNFGKEQSAAPAGTFCANARCQCGVMTCRRGISVIDSQGYCNATVAVGGGLQGQRAKDVLMAGIGMEGSLCQGFTRSSEKNRTHSAGLQLDHSILEPSSPCKGCPSSELPSGISVVACSPCTSGDDDDKTVNRKLSRMKVSLRTLAIGACFGGIGTVVTVLLSTLPPDFESRWRMLLHGAPQGEGPSQGRPQLPTVLYDRHGTVIATIAPGGYSCEQNDALQRRSGRSGNSNVPIAEIPSWLWQAVVASEDRRFFQHQGVDPRGLSRAVLSLASRGGGSTITQQLIKNVVLTNERKWTRKLSEIILALVLEKQMSKWDILHNYLKKIYWGHGVYGIDAASSLYFGKHPSLLTLGECAMLAGIIPAPELLSPYRDRSRGKIPQGRALRRMVESGFLDTASAVESLKHPLRLARESREGTLGPWRAPYFVSEVLSELTQKYGWSKVASGGLQVHTTLDLSMQTVAEKVVVDHLHYYDKERILLANEGLQKTQERLKSRQTERHEQVTAVVKGASKSEEHLKASMSRYQEEIKAAEKSRMEGAMIAIDPLSGAVRVLVGGRDCNESSFNWGIKAYRSAELTLQPLVYLTALAAGLKRDHVLMDEPFTIGGLSSVCSDRKFCGKVCEMGRALGIETFLPHEFALLLASCEVTPMQLAMVYATIAAGGVYHAPHLITRVESQEGQILEEHKPSKSEQQVPIVNQRVVTELRRLLQSTVDKGTGRAAQLGQPCAGKTGTSYQSKDVLFAGFTPEISCVVRLGYADYAPVGNLYPVTGASHAAPLWKEFLETVHQGIPVRKSQDTGSGEYGSTAPRQFGKRSRRVTRVGLHKIRKHRGRKNESVPWQQVWDWERASLFWKEQDRMDDWVAHRLRKATRSPIPWTGLDRLVEIAPRMLSGQL